MEETFENEECYKIDDMCDPYYTETNNIPDLMTYNNGFIRLLRLYDNHYSDRLDKADDSYIKSSSGTLVIKSLNVSRQYFNSKLDCNIGKNLAHDNVVMSAIRRDKNNRVLYNRYSDVKVSASPTHSRFSLLLSYDRLGSQVFPMINTKYIEEVNDFMIEYLGTNSKIVVLKNDMCTYVVDLDADRRQEITLSCNHYILKDIEFVSKGGTRWTSNISDIDAMSKRLTGLSFVAKNRVTGEEYDLSKNEEITRLFIEDYINKFGVLLKKDMDRGDKHSYSSKYGWFVTSPSIDKYSIPKNRLEKVEYCFNFYSICSWILDESTIELSENEWKLVRKSVIEHDHAKMDLYAKLDNGHRVVALHSDYAENTFDLVSEHVSSKKITIDMKESNLVREYLLKYIDTDFSITQSKFKQAQKTMLDLMIKNKEVYLYDNEQDMNEHLYKAESDIKIGWNKSILRIGFYNKVWNKYVVMYIDMSLSMFHRLYRYFAFLEFKYPFCISEGVMRNRLDNDLDRDILDNMLIDNISISSMSLVLNDILIAGGNNNDFEAIVLDEIKLTTKLVVLYNTESDSRKKEKLKVIDINKIIPLLKILANKTNDTNYAVEIACKIGRYNKFNLYVSRVIGHNNKYKYTQLKVGDSFHNYTNFFGDSEVIDLDSLKII